jgi:hypothetical protein
MSKRLKKRVPATGVHVRSSLFAFKFPPQTWWEEDGAIYCEKCHQPIQFEFGWRSCTPNIDKNDFNWLIPTHAKCACGLVVRLKEIPERKRQQRNSPQQALFDFQQVTNNEQKQNT